MNYDNRYDFDAFISHAVEDKLPIANELCERLENAGLKIWYSGKELRAGDRLEDSIQNGLQTSRFGIVILSPTYVSKMWTLREFYSLLSREQKGHKVILPILYNITPEELAKKDLTMAGMFSLRAEKGMDYLVNYLVNEIKPGEIDQRVAQGSHNRSKLKQWPVIAGILIIVALAYLGFMRSGMDMPGPQEIDAGIQKRIEVLNAEIENSIQQHGLVEGIDSMGVAKKYLRYQILDTRYRNEYHLSSGFREAHSKKQVQALLAKEFDALSFMNNYGIKAVSIFTQVDSARSPEIQKFGFFNLLPVEFSKGPVEELGQDLYTIKVSYSENVRFVQTSLHFPSEKNADSPKRYEVRIYALLPTETLLYQKKDGVWDSKVFEP